MDRFPNAFVFSILINSASRFAKVEGRGMSGRDFMRLQLEKY